jgi:hypothetical protein
MEVKRIGDFAIGILREERRGVFAPPGYIQRDLVVPECNEM